MKNIAINNLKYTGTVTLSQYIGSKKVKILQVANSGANPLFDFLSDCLIGDFDIARINRPNKIRLLEFSESDNIVNASAFIYLLSKPEKVYTNYSGSTVRYSFIVPRDILESINFNGIGLYTNAAVDREDYSAYTRVNLNNSSISTSSLLVIDWELNITNATKSINNI